MPGANDVACTLGLATRVLKEAIGLGKLRADLPAPPRQLNGLVRGPSVQPSLCLPRCPGHLPGYGTYWFLCETGSVIGKFRIT